MSSNTFATAHASGESWQDAANQCLDLLTKDPLPPGGLGLLYISDTIANEMAQVLELFRERTGLSNWLGSVGIGICATGREYFDEPAVAAMVADLAPSGYRLFDGVDENLDNFNAEHSDWINTTGSHVAIVHADPRNPDAAGLIEDLANQLDGFLVGGFVSSRSAMPQIAGEQVEGGLSGALLADSVPVISGLTQSCLLIGNKHTITACEENVLIELDGRPALQVFEEDIGELMSRDLRRVGGSIFAALPVPGSDTGDYLVRNLVGLDEPNGFIAIGEHVEEGESIQFCRRDPAAAAEDLTQMVTRLKERAAGNAKGAVYFSCLARGPNMFGPNSRELTIVQEALGSVPLVGFFCNGEISHDRLYSYTGVLTLFV